MKTIKRTESNLPRMLLDGVIGLQKFLLLQTVLLLSIVVSTHGQAIKESKLSYCANIGHVDLILKNDSVSGQYRITVVKESIEGTINGILKNGLLDAIWTDPEGSGRIIFGFTSHFNEFTAIYNDHRNASHWFNSPWKGIRREYYDTLPEDRKLNFRCSSK